MAINPYLQTPYLQPYYPPMPTQPQNSTNVIWVANEQEARNYPVAAGNTVILMDNDNPVAYKKSSDMSGRSLPIEIYDLVRRNAPQDETAKINLDEYLTKKDFDEFRISLDRRLTEMQEESNQEMMMVPVKKRGRKPNEDGESI